MPVNVLRHLSIVAKRNHPLSTGLFDSLTLGNRLDKGFAPGNVSLLAPGENLPQGIPQ